jgi:hypothetical protein
MANEPDDEWVFVQSLINAVSAAIVSQPRALVLQPGEVPKIKALIAQAKNDRERQLARVALERIAAQFTALKQPALAGEISALSDRR